MIKIINIKINALKLLKSLEKIFLKKMGSAKNFNYIGSFDGKTINTLKKNGLIEEKQYSIIGLPKNNPNKAIFPKITFKKI